MVRDTLIRYGVSDEALRRKKLQVGVADTFYSTVLEKIRYLQTRSEVMRNALQLVDSPSVFRQLENKSLEIWSDAQHWRGRDKMNERLAEWIRRKK